MKVAFFDLESTSLDGEGRILCGSVYSYPEGKMYTYVRDDLNNGFRPWDDRSVVKAIRDKLNEHQLLVGWFSKGFDAPLLNTRLSFYGMNRLNRHFHCDLCFYAKGWHGIKPRNARLATVAEFYNLERKMHVDRETWIRADHGDDKAMKIIASRCESDVRILYEIYWKLLPFVGQLSRYGQ